MFLETFLFFGVLSFITYEKVCRSFLGESQQGKGWPAPGGAGVQGVCKRSLEEWRTESNTVHTYYCAASSFSSIEAAFVFAGSNFTAFL